MSIIYDPKKMLRKIAPPKKVRGLVTKKATLKKTALSFVSDVDFIDRKSIADVALKTIKAYKARIKDDPAIKAGLIKESAQLIQRVQNEVVLQISEGIKERYAGEFYIWLPSDADEPDPEHQLNYGKRFQIGDGEQPGDRYGCRCGMEILVNGSTLDLA